MACRFVQRSAGRITFLLALVVASFAVSFAVPPVASGQAVTDAFVVDPIAEGIVEQSLEEVLSTRDLRHLKDARVDPSSSEPGEMPQWLEDFLEWLFGSNPSGGGLDGSVLETLRAVLYAVVFVVVLAVVLLIARAVVARGRTGAGAALGDEAEEDEELDAGGPPGERPPRFYFERADAFASAGQWRAAVREVLLASMSWTERRGLIRHRRGLTNRAYVRALRRHKRAQRSFARLAGQFEMVFYGRRAATEHRYVASRDAFEEGFRE